MSQQLNPQAARQPVTPNDHWWGWGVVVAIIAIFALMHWGKSPPANPVKQTFASTVGYTQQPRQLNLALSTQPGSSQPSGSPGAGYVNHLKEMNGMMSIHNENGQQRQQDSQRHQNNMAEQRARDALAEAAAANRRSEDVRREAEAAQRRAEAARRQAEYEKRRGK